MTVLPGCSWPADEQRTVPVPAGQLVVDPVDGAVEDGADDVWVDDVGDADDVGAVVVDDGAADEAVVDEVVDDGVDGEFSVSIGVAAKCWPATELTPDGRFSTAEGAGAGAVPLLVIVIGRSCSGPFGTSTTGVAGPVAVTDGLPGCGVGLLLDVVVVVGGVVVVVGAGLGAGGWGAGFAGLGFAAGACDDEVGACAAAGIDWAPLCAVSPTASAAASAAPDAAT
ncbi:MAG: hypothetical protein J2O49_05015, partial [Sciscionella sp.]|nr:hypothetical protein [Sciscionella sp.]